MRKILVIGATSAIAQATARLFAEAGDAIFIVARSKEKLDAVRDDLKIRGAASVHMETLDVLDYDRHKSIIDTAINELRGLDLALIAHGALPDQQACEQSADLTCNNFEINTLSAISLLTYLANYFEVRKHGTITVISSVAGDRGRQSNYVYGSAKGALTIFLQGLRNRLYKSGVHVLTIKPGFVDTPMTAKFEKGILWASPEKVGKDIYVAMQKSRNVIYIPFFWKYIMAVIRFMPETLFRRLSL